MASEHLNRATRGLTVRSNLVRDCLMGGFFIGGYDESTTGSAEGCKITHNTFIDNDTVPASDEYGQVYLQYRVKNCVFANNLMSHGITKGGVYNTFIIQWNTTGSGNQFENNLFYGPDTPVWGLNNSWLEGWADYQGASENSGDGWGVPLLSIDYVPGLGSPAVDAGKASWFGVGERDYRGNIRPVLGPDCGSVERGGVTLLAPEPFFQLSGG